MIKYEYDITVCAAHNVRTLLQKWVDAGWELVSVVPYGLGDDRREFYFRREKK